MKYTRAIALAVLAGATIVSTGCAVQRGQETVGAYVDDAAITTAIKAKFVEDKTVVESTQTYLDSILEGPLLPPPRPAPCGILFFSSMETRSITFVCSKKIFAARTARFSSPFGTDE